MTFADSLKVHLRVVTIHGVELRVVSLRPQTVARFSTNFFHETWHVVSNPAGAAIFGTLLWGLAFQRKPGTLVLLDGEHLVPTPFEADPPDPIALVPAHLTQFDVELLRALRVRLRRAPVAPTTIRWHAFGLDQEPRTHWRELRRAPIASRERMTRRAGAICYTAPPELLRANGAGIHAMTDWDGWGGYHPMADYHPTEGHWHDGEFQVFDTFLQRVSAARVARREVLGEDAPHRLATDDERAAIHRRADAALRRLEAARA